MLTVTLTHSYIRISVINIRDDLWLGLSQLCQEHNRLDFGAVFKSIIGSLHNWLKPSFIQMAHVLQNTSLYGHLRLFLMSSCDSYNNCES